MSTSLFTNPADWCFEKQEAELDNLRSAVSWEAVDELMRPLGMRCTGLETLPSAGVNNPVYAVETSSALKLVLRVTNPNPLVAGHKTQSEVEAMSFCRRATSIPVPEIVGFESDRGMSPLGFEYILMERIQGIPLSGVWTGLDRRVRQKLCFRIVEIIAELEAAPLPYANAQARIGGFGPNLTPGGIARGPPAARTFRIV